MYYFLKKEKFNLEKHDFDVQCVPRFTKKECEVFDILIRNYKPEASLSELDIKKIKYPIKETSNIIDSLNKKSILLHVYDSTVDISILNFSIFDLAVFENSKIIYTFTKGIKLAYKNGNIFSRIDILSFLRFDKNYTRDVFKMIIRDNKRKGSVKLSLDDFKNKLGIKSNRYTRYYDFERKVLNPIINDIERANIILNFEKIKNSDAKTSRIIGIKINYTDLYHLEIHRDINDLLKKYAHFINDFTRAYESIYDYRKIKSYEDTVDYIEKNKNKLFKGLES